MRYGSWINHLVKRGNIVVFSRYQQNEYTTLSINFTSNVVASILRAIDTLQAHPAWTQPQLDNIFYMGHSYGGLISANLATKYANYGIPKPKAIFMACPSYGQYPGGQLSNYSTMDSTIAMLVVIERDDHVVDSTFALQVFNQTTAVSYSHKNLIIHYADSTGTMPVASTHGESSCVDSIFNNGDVGIVMSQADFAYTDASDFYCYWKLFDAMQDCALTGNGCTTAFGDTPEQKNMGQWSNGIPVTPLEVRPKNVLASVINNDFTKRINVYPNPSNVFFTFEVELSNLNENYTLEVYNALGVKVNRASQTFYHLLTIDLSSEPKGAYSYFIVDKNKTLVSKGKLVLQ